MRPRRTPAEKLFNKPSIKKSALDKLRTDVERPTRRFEKEDRGPRPDFDKARGEFRPRLEEPGKERPFRRFEKDERGPRREFDKPRGEFRPRREDSGSDRPARSFGKDERGPRREFDKPRGEFRPHREDSSSDRPARSFDKDERGPRREFDKPRGEFRPRREDSGSDRPARSFDKDDRGPRREFDKPRGEFRSRREDSGSDRPARSFDKDERGPRREFDKPRGEFRPRREESGSERPARSFDKGTSVKPSDRKREEGTGEGESRRVGKFTQPPRYDFSEYQDKKKKHKKNTDDDVMRLNRYIANAGICSRREADELIESGQITVNGKVVNEMGYKVKRSDTIKYGKKVLNPERMVYLLINKPKDYITTTEDPEERKTVLDLIDGACQERIYPVGRLDRNTTGLLLLTNDGELAEKLTHPSGNVKKIYQAELDRPITTEDFEAMKAGFELEDGFIKPDEIGIVTPDAMVVGLEIHSGRNRIVRRMFENFGYEVKKLDRTVFAGLNKKDLPRGKWRFLSEKEVVKLKFML
ncbi:pseudouridine synthase [Arundinibacter roseus]|uniref:Pseudouridine synthase n=2 Tax=Arundinibacter roseus TaxID=2070510 RepID=A0A4R4K7D9_9BACT|nr:pseudouridine synthase [Arundinibacter roseus]